VACLFGVELKQSCFHIVINHFGQYGTSVVTLALGSRLRQGLARVRAKSEPESHISCS